MGPYKQIDEQLPKPWVAFGYSLQSLENVLRVDYRGAKVRRGVYAVPGGDVTVVTRAEDLRACQPGRGTVLILWPRRDVIDNGECVRVADTADQRGMKVASL